MKSKQANLILQGSRRSENNSGRQGDNEQKVKTFLMNSWCPQTSLSAMKIYSGRTYFLTVGGYQNILLAMQCCNYFETSLFLVLLNASGVTPR